MPNEVELKLRIRTVDLPRLRRHPAVTQYTIGKPVTRKLVSIYYDTPQLALLDRDLSLRVRRMSGGWFQAVKGAGHSLAGLHQRMEWEDIIAHGEPDFSKITDPALTSVFDDLELRAALRPIFTTDVRRTEWQMTLADGSHVEMALDMGELIAGDAREPICEVELELKQGQPLRLFEFALALQADIPLWIENVSKAQRGYGYYRSAPPVPRHARSVGLKPAMQVADACRTVLWECIAHLQGNHDVTAHGGDPEGVHQMRVALRRMRSAITLFRAAMAPDDGLVDELRWLGQTLGEARDLDVFLTQTLPPLREQLAHPGLPRLQQKAERAHRAAYAAVREALESQRYQRLLLAMGVWLEQPSAAAASQPLADYAEHVLNKRHKSLLRRGEDVHEQAPEQRHAMRIAAKKMRYAAEFFAGLYDERKARHYLQRLTKLQEVLGTLNDIAVTEHLLGQLAGSRPDAALREALALFAGWNALRASRALAVLEKTWKQYHNAKPFWA